MGKIPGRGKLSLTKTTLRLLAGGDLSIVVGGVDNSATEDNHSTGGAKTACPEWCTGVGCPATRGCTIRSQQEPCPQG